MEKPISMSEPSTWGGGEAEREGGRREVAAVEGAGWVREGGGRAVVGGAGCENAPRRSKSSSVVVGDWQEAEELPPSREELVSKGSSSSSGFRGGREEVEVGAGEREGG